MSYKVTKIFLKSRNRMEQTTYYKTVGEAAGVIDDWIELSGQTFEFKSDELDKHYEWHLESYILCLDEVLEEANQ